MRWIVKYPPRHYLVWLNYPLCHDSLKELDEGVCAVVVDWFSRGLPAIVRRRAEDEPDHAVPLGIPLSPRRGRRRIALSVAASAVHKVRPPLTLRQVIGSAPASWRSPLTGLDDGFTAAGLTLRVYGSLAWQHITGESYLTDRSDVDLLLRLENQAQLEKALSLLQDWERQTHLRADGEFQLPNGAAVAWRELLGSQNKVLVKTAQAVRLYPVAELFSVMEPGYESATP